MPKESIFLTTEQAIKAIIIDFRQYKPQLMLFCSIIGLLSNEAVHFKREPGKAGVWMNQGSRSNMVWMNGVELIEFMCATVERTHWTPELLASICSRVFQSRTFPAADPATGQAGLQIQTDMEAFSCRQCGRCCRRLDYRREITGGDVAHWKDLGRQDILKWVETSYQAGKADTYRVWVVPGTQRLAEVCPFLKKDTATNLWGCRIHEVKPQICRNYPVSRKHAGMTGCLGFAQI